MPERTTLLTHKDASAASDQGTATQQTTEPAEAAMPLTSHVDVKQEKGEGRKVIRRIVGERVVETTANTVVVEYSLNDGGTKLVRMPRRQLILGPQPKSKSS